MIFGRKHLYYWVFATLVLLSFPIHSDNRAPTKYRRRPTTFKTTNKTIKRLRKMIINHVEFEETAVSTIFTYLKQRSKQLDPKGKGINFILLKSKTQKDEPRLTLDVDKMPLYTLIDYICKAADYQYRIETHGVLIAPPGVPLQTMETRTFVVSPQTIQTLDPNGKDD